MATGPKAASLVALALLLAAAVCQATAPARAEDAGKGAAAPQVLAPKVTVITAQEREVTASVIVSGTLVPRDEVLVAPEIDGLAVTELLAEEGDTVSKGQVLARLSRTKLDVELAQNRASLARNDAAIAQARAQIVDAQATKAQADSTLARTESLKGSGVSSAAQYDQSVAAARSSAAKLNAAQEGLAVAMADRELTEAQRSEIEINLRRTEIRAPAAGLISRRGAKVGALASMAGDPLFRIIADGAIELEADIPETDLPRIRIGQPVAVTPPGAAKPITGTVRLISPEVDRTTRLGRVRISLPPGAPVSIGSFARGVIETGRHTGVTLPVQAVTYTREGPIVQAVKDGRVVSHKVVLGLVGGGLAEIVSGLDAGETVVARAGTFVRDGDPVTAVPLPEGQQAKEPVIQ